MPCTGRFAEATDYAQIMCADYDPTDAVQKAQIELALDIAAGDIHAAMAAAGACSCTLASWATNYLIKLNVIDAAVIQQCSCSTDALTDAKRQLYLEWLDRQYELIRIGKIELCQNSTGMDVPYIAQAEIGYTEFGQAQIIINRHLRGI